MHTCSANRNEHLCGGFVMVQYESNQVCRIYSLTWHNAGCLFHKKKKGDLYTLKSLDASKSRHNAYFSTVHFMEMWSNRLFFPSCEQRGNQGYIIQPSKRQICLHPCLNSTTVFYPAPICWGVWLYFFLVIDV